jgi:ribosomal protein S27AE
MMAEANESAGHGTVLTQVCLNCGKEYFFENAAPADDLVCERCGGTVFRSFFATPDPNDAQRDFLDATSRDTTPEDPGTDITPGDLHDLNNP